MSIECVLQKYLLKLENIVESSTYYYNYYYKISFTPIYFFLFCQSSENLRAKTCGNEVINFSTTRESKNARDRNEFSGRREGARVSIISAGPFRNQITRMLLGKSSARQEARSKRGNNSGSEVTHLSAPTTPSCHPDVASGLRY